MTSFPAQLEVEPLILALTRQGYKNTVTVILLTLSLTHSDLLKFENRTGGEVSLYQNFRGQVNIILDEGNWNF